MCINYLLLKFLLFYTIFSIFERSNPVWSKAFCKYEFYLLWYGKRWMDDIVDFTKFEQEVISL